MTKRKKTIYMMRNQGSGPNNGGVIRDRSTDKIQVFWQAKDSPITDHLQGLTSRDARLLAKRINQFLDGGG